MTMNAMFYPNAISSVYFVLSLILTALSLKKDESKIAAKKILCNIVLALALISTIVKLVFLIRI
jgi:heme/copper-type cytochrome/quinol oxidase subunit 4